MWPSRRESKNIPTLDPTLGDSAAARLLADLGRRDWRAVHELLRTVDDPDDLQFYVDLTSRTPGLQAWIGQWSDAEPHSYLPMLVRGAHAVDWAWLARGTALAKDTSATQFGIFVRRLRIAQECLSEAAARNPHDPTAWSELIVCGVGMSLGIDAAANQSVRHPAYRRRLGWQRDHNTFAMAFWMAEEYDAAAEMFDVLGDQVTAKPWRYLAGPPAKAFALARDAAYRRRSAAVILQ
jgi:hypothetical protein